VTFEAGSQLSTIGSCVLSQCFSLLWVSVPSGIEEIGGGIPVHLKNNFKSVNERFILRGDCFFSLESKSLIQYFGEQEEVDLVGAIGEFGTDLSVVRLGPFSFATTLIGYMVGHNLVLKSICIPSSVEILCKGCFYECKNLSSVIFEIGSKLSVIDKRAFMYCTSLTSICLPATVKTLGQSCFADCWSLSSFKFESGSQLVSIGDFSFVSCFPLTSICIPATVKSLGMYCFRHCSDLSSFTFESRSQLVKIGEGFLDGSLELTSICIPSSVEEIGAHIFGELERFPKVTFEPGSKYLANHNNTFEA
jgi:hypothetical protein